MSETTADAPATSTEADQPDQHESEQRPTETVDFWKQKAREQEKRAKENAVAAKRLAELEESQKSEAEKAADRVAKAESEVAGIPARVADSLRTYLIDLHKIDKDDAELFLTATDPDLLLKQAARLLERSDQRKPANYVPREGASATSTGEGRSEREFARNLFGGE